MDKPNRFLDNMVSYGLGKVVDNMADLQKQIVEAVRETGKQGTLTLTLKYKRSGPHGMSVDPTVKPVIPTHPIKQVEMFADEEGLLHDHNPDQLTHENVIPIDTKKENIHEA